MTNGFSIRVICIEAQMKSTMALTLCHSHLPSAHSNTLGAEMRACARNPPTPSPPPLFLFTALIPRIYCRGAAVIVHIKSRTVVSIHASFAHMAHTAKLNIHDPMKYTWRRRARLLHTIRRPSRNSHVCSWNAVVSAHLPTRFNKVFRIFVKKKTTVV